MSIYKKYTSFKEFYPFYLSEHMNPICRILHFVGTLFVICVFAGSFFNIKILFFAPFFGYGLAWIGHYFFEKKSSRNFHLSFI